MKKLKLMTIIGTRPEIIKLSEIIKLCDNHFDHILVHTGQNYDYSLNDVFFSDLNLRHPDYFLNVVGANLGMTLGNIISKSYDILVNIQPDALLVLGDTNSCLSVISAKRLKIPTFHLEAGNRCFDQNLPEEINRRIVDHTSDINLCYSEHARNYLYSEGISMDRTFVVGSPMAEVIKKHNRDIENSDVLSRLGLSEYQYILLSAHREENIDNEENFMKLMESINYIAQTYMLPVIYSIHPRSNKKISEKNIVFHPNVRKMIPFGFVDYNKLQMKSFCVISDSGTLAEEASILNFPAVSIRTSTERPEAIDKGKIILGGIDFISITQSIEMATKIRSDEDNNTFVSAYVDENVSTKVAKIIQSYTSYVNKSVWRKR